MNTAIRVFFNRCFYQLESSTNPVQHGQECDRCVIVIGTYTAVLIRGRSELCELRDFNLNS